ncbi:MAG: mechanosensitive ion channel family protein [Xanthobacteraceae bacterium]
MPLRLREVQEMLDGAITTRPIAQRSVGSVDLMGDGARSSSALADALFWAPDWLPSIALLVVAVVAALIAHRVLYGVLARAFGDRHPFAQTILRRIRGPLALALVAFVLAAVLQSAAFSPAAAESFGRVLLIAFIVLAGWSAHVATEAGSALYLRRFQSEASDTLLARSHVTQVRILKRALHTLIVVTLSAVLMTFEPVRQYGVSLFASAGVAGLVAGLAARPVLSNLIAGIQIATTQPIRIDDQVIVENEAGRIEEITSTYVVIRLWDLRRLIVPLSYFIEKPFQNWTRESTNLIGTVILHVDFSAPVEAIRAKFTELLKVSPLWDGDVAKLQVTEMKEAAVELRALVSARSAADVFDLRCQVREELIAFLQKTHPTALPHTRAQTMGTDVPGLARESLDRRNTAS